MAAMPTGVAPAAPKRVGRGRRTGRTRETPEVGLVRRSRPSRAEDGGASRGGVVTRPVHWRAGAGRRPRWRRRRRARPAGDVRPAREEFALAWGRAPPPGSPTPRQMVMSGPGTAAHPRPGRSADAPVPGLASGPRATRAARTGGRSRAIWQTRGQMGRDGNRGADIWRRTPILPALASVAASAPSHGMRGGRAGVARRRPSSAASRGRGP